MIIKTERTALYPSKDKPWMKYYDSKPKYQMDPETNLLAFVKASNRNNLDSIAIEYQGNRFSYADFFDRIEKCRDNLAALGLKNGDVITVQSLAVPQAYILLYAASLLGICINFIYVTATEEEIHSFLQETESKLFITMDFLYASFQTDFLNEIPVMILSVSDEMTGLKKTFARILLDKKVDQKLVRWKFFIKENHPKVSGEADGSLPVAMVYTGGTTGKSKAVVLNSHNINYFAWQLINSSMNYRRGATTLNTLPPFIAYGLTVGFHLSISAGIRLILEPDASLDSAAKLYSKHRPNYFASGCVQAERILERAKSKNLSLDFVEQFFAGGDAMPIQKEQELNEILSAQHSTKRILCGYGMSEVSALIATSTPEVMKAGTVGVPAILTNIKIVDTESGDELPCNETGEICVSSPCIMQGYYKNPKATNEIIEVDQDNIRWLHTGDLGFVDEEGFLTIVGRIKRMILTREGATFHKIFPKLLEEKVEQVEGVLSCIIVGVPDYERVNVLAAFIIKGKEYSEQEIVNAVKGHLAEEAEGFEMPRYFYMIDQMPRTSIGKVDFVSLEKRAAALFQTE